MPGQRGPWVASVPESQVESTASTLNAFDQFHRSLNALHLSQTTLLNTFLGSERNYNSWSCRDGMFAFSWSHLNKVATSHLDRSQVASMPYPPLGTLQPSFCSIWGSGEMEYGGTRQIFQNPLMRQNSFTQLLFGRNMWELGPLSLELPNLIPNFFTF